MRTYHFHPPTPEGLRCAPVSLPPRYVPRREQKAMHAAGRAGPSVAARLKSLIGVTLAAASLVGLLVGCTSEGAPAGDQQALAEQALGIRVVRISLVAGGGLIDLRYQVTDPEKAALALGGSAHGHDRLTIEEIRESPQLVDEATGIALLEAQIHYMGRVQTQRLNPKAGLTRPILFSNTKGLVERGSEVSLAIGDVRLEHLVVQ